MLGHLPIWVSEWNIHIHAARAYVLRYTYTGRWVYPSYTYTSPPVYPSDTYTWKFAVYVYIYIPFSGFFVYNIQIYIAVLVAYNQAFFINVLLLVNITLIAKFTPFCYPFDCALFTILLAIINVPWL